CIFLVFLLFIYFLLFLCFSFSIHLAVYVSDLLPRPFLYLSSPLINPIVPMDIRSSVSSTVLSNFFTMWATNRKLCSMSLFPALWSPSCINLIYFASSIGERGCGNAWCFT